MKRDGLTVSVISAFGLVAVLAGCAGTPKPDATAAATPAPVASKKPLDAEAAVIAANKVDILFPEGGAALTPEANKQLDLAARLYRDASPVVMFTTGYADKSGNEYDNLLLSAQRAEAVKQGLVARGIPADRLMIQALGVSELADPTDPVAAQNRRVTITWRL